MEDLRINLKILWTDLCQLFSSCYIPAYPTLRCTHGLFLAIILFIQYSVFFSHMPNTAYDAGHFQMSLSLGTVISPTIFQITTLGASAAPENSLNSMKSSCWKFLFFNYQRCSRQSNIVQYSQNDAAHMCHKLGRWIWVIHLTTFS